MKAIKAMAKAMRALLLLSAAPRTTIMSPRGQCVVTAGLLSNKTKQKSDNKAAPALQ